MIPEIPNWKEISTHLRIGEIVLATVTLKPIFGAFVHFEIEGVPAPIKGLITTPYMGATPGEALEVQEKLHIGQTMLAVVISMDSRGGTMLSIRKADLADPSQYK